MNVLRVGKVRLSLPAVLLCWGTALFSLLPATVAAKEKWETVAAEDLAAMECKAYPGSSVEVLLEKQELNTSGDDQIARHHRRIKIYSPKGARDAGIFNIDYPTEQKVWDLEARHIKQGGAIVEFVKKDFTESVVAKTSSLKIKRLALAVPDLGVGDVLEMRWTETVESDVSTFRWWYIQDAWPIRHFVFSLRNTIQDCRLIPFNLAASEKKTDKPQKNVMEFFDIPPFVEEPYMPPTRDVRAWFVLLYTSSYMRWFTKDDVWKELSMELEEEFRLLIKPGSAIRAKAAELVQGAATDDEKLQRLYEYCRQEVTNVDYFKSAEIQEALKKLERKDGEQSPAQTLERKTGKSRHINELFASLAKAAGYEPRRARSSSRYDTLKIQHSNGWLFVPDDLVMIKFGEQWKSYAPGDYFMPVGMLDKSNELALSLICDPKKIIMEPNPAAPADKSPVRRKGRFKLDVEGNLEGEVEVSMDGHSGITRKKTWRSKQQQEVDEDYRAGITKRLPAAEISGLKWENLSGNKLPLIVRYHISIPAYADVAGSKVIIPANVFEHGAPAVFTSETRVHPIYFDHAWSEHDDIEISLPEGYTLEGGSSPANLGDTAGVVGVGYQVGYKPKARTLVYKRNFALGGNGVIAMPASFYSKLKDVFDTIQRSDEHTFVLKPVPVATNSSPAIPPTSP